MGRYVISICMATLLVGFVFLLGSLGLPALSTSDPATYQVNSGEGRTPPPAPNSTGSSAIPDLVPPPAPTPESPYGSPPPAEPDYPGAPWSSDRVHEELIAPKAPAIHVKSVDYPKKCLAKAAPKEKVSVAYDVDAGGQVISARITKSSNSCFDRTALHAVKNWTFAPSGTGFSSEKTFIFVRPT